MKTVRIIALAMLALCGATGRTHADPGIDVALRDGVLRVTLEGSYAGARYLISRSAAPQGQFDPLDSQQTLCTGDCFAVDPMADAGQTYYYQFDLYWPDDARARYGPYAVTVPNPPLSVRVWPNPVQGAGAHVDLTLPGSRREAAVDSEARIVDLRGRMLKMLYAGPLVRGTSSIPWDGRDQAGNRLRPGTYFVQLKSALGTGSARFVAL